MAERLIAHAFDLRFRSLDPVAALEKLLESGRRGFLIEKSGPAEDVSFLGVEPFEVLRVRGGRAFSETAAGKKPLTGNPFEALGRRLEAFRCAGGRPFAGGAVGLLTYEMSRHLERLPARADAAEEAALMLFRETLVIDRRRRRCEWVVLLPEGGGAGAREMAAGRAEVIRLIMAALPPERAAAPARASDGAGPWQGSLGRPAFLRGVRALKERIRAGDIFQGVLSESFSRETAAGPFAVYRALRRVSPSPYLFFIQDGDEHLMGASPERLVAVLDGTARNCPIAGTRPRGATAARDKAFERAMVRSPKERAEHLMLVDLARNDLGRVCAPGTVKVTELMQVRRFSNVMHLVSEVEGRLEEGRSAWDCLMASFPAGTVSGAPKVRAMELLAALEPRARGFYAGAVLQHDFAGNLDSCIAIRSLSMTRAEGDAWRVRAQAGAGIVADSDPAREYQEVMNKLSGVRLAVATADAAASEPETIDPLRPDGLGGSE